MACGTSQSQPFTEAHFCCTHAYAAHGSAQYVWVGLSSGRSRLGCEVQSRVSQSLRSGKDHESWKTVQGQDGRGGCQAGSAHGGGHSQGG